MRSTDIDRSYFIDNLDRAISEGFIQAYYMPIIRSSNGRVSEEEALARWDDPDRGIMVPAEFIPVLEEARLIHKLDLKIVDEVLKKMKAQKDAGLYVGPISVNLSRIDFDECDIVEEIRNKVDASGITRDRLIIEITESVLGKDLAYMKKQIERFHELGFSVWMDDFGAGYSSLDVLQDINFDHIKFDIKFMQNFDREKTRIMLTELMRMSMALDTKTICEGVETSKQAEFLREIGCNKMQGFFFCKPVSLPQILERYSSGTQIGFENPEESPYYAAIGSINLYDLSVIGTDDRDDDSMRRYFDTLPICVYESDDEGYSIVRCNKAYRNFEERYFEPILMGQTFRYADYATGYNSVYSASVRKCCESGERTYFAETLPDGSKMRAIVRKIADNPVTGVSACVIVILDIIEATGDMILDYGQVASALSSDYVYLYYVNIDTEQFVEYSHSTEDGSLSVQRNGGDFFSNTYKDAQEAIYIEDRERFLTALNKENFINAVNENNMFNITYRLMVEGEPVYVNMKAVHMGPHHVIIGINNVDVQMKLQKEHDRMREERMAFSMVKALVGDFICIYVVDPDTGSYTEYSSDASYDELGITKSGDDFFETSREQSLRVIYSEDVDLFKVMFTKEKMLCEIENSGRFNMIYRLMINGKPEYVNLDAAMIEEDGTRQIIVGVKLYR
jgi:EAL domain-containing protein (putative c-di-GMP-specific phosphodiesterase class I)